MQTKSLVVLAAALLLVASVAPAVAADGSLAVSVEQHDDGSATATVTHNDTTVENATVEVEAVDGNYSDEGTHTTDANGTVLLEAPGENVTIDVVAEYENETANTTKTLTVVENSTTQEFDSFGAEVSWYVHRLLADWDGGPGIGQSVAEFVVENNPGNAPDHAGPPSGSDSPAAANGGNQSAVGGPDADHGPPDHAGSNGNANGHGK